MKNIKKNNFKKVEEFKEVRIITSRSNSTIYAQAFDIQSGKVLAAASSLKISKKKPTETAKEVGIELAKKISKIEAKYIFDRNGYLYHGQVKALAEGLRQGGINI